MTSRERAKKHKEIAMSKLTILVGAALIFAVAATESVFSEVSPEIQLGARGVMSFNTDIKKDQTANTVSDFSDTDLMLGLRQKLYNKWRGQLVIGFQFPDAESDLGQVFFHQTFIKLENKSNIFKMGRSRVQTSLVQFPTLRDDDALQLTTVLNPFSSGEDSEDHQYGNVLEYDHIFGQRFWFRLHAEHFRKAPAERGAPETDFGLNAIGFVLQYRVPLSQRWNRPFIQSVGLSMNNFLTDRPGFTSEYDRAMKNLIFGFVVNLRPDPVHFWDLRSQTIYNAGFDEVTTIGDFSELARAEAIASFSSIRYLYRRLERPTLQVALSGGYKKFLNTSRTTELIQAVGSVFYRLGQNFDVGVQVQYQSFSGDLKEMYGASEGRFQLSFIYSIDQSWNNQFDDRESLLNLEHGYIP
jgi:hypothetical protein